LVNDETPDTRGGGGSGWGNAPPRREAVREAQKESRGLQKSNQSMDQYGGGNFGWVTEGSGRELKSKPAVKRGTSERKAARTGGQGQSNWELFFIKKAWLRKAGDLKGASTAKTADIRTVIPEIGLLCRGG